VLPIVIAAIGLVVGGAAEAAEVSSVTPVCHGVPAAVSPVASSPASGSVRRIVVVKRPADPVVVNVGCGEARGALPAASAIAAVPPPLAPTVSAVATITTAPAASAAASAGKSDPEKSDAAILANAVVQIVRLLVLLAFVWPVVLLASQAIGIARRAVARGRRDRGIRYTSHWGGFGGADSGWTLGPAAVDLLVAAVLAVSAAVLGAVIVQALDARLVSVEAMAKPAGKSTP
jgi:hypothetical protein